MGCSHPFKGMRAPNTDLCANDDSCSVALVPIPIPIPTYPDPRPTPIPDPSGSRANGCAEVESCVAVWRASDVVDVVQCALDVLQGLREQQLEIVASRELFGDPALDPNTSPLVERRPLFGLPVVEVNFDSLRLA